MRRHRYNRGQWRVERERHQLPDGPPAPHGRIVPVRDLVPQLLARVGLEDQAWLHELEAEWPSLVGAPVAAHTRPGRYRDGLLIVFVDSSVWLSELQRFGQRQMLDRMHKRFGRNKVRKVRLQIDPEPKPG